MKSPITTHVLDTSAGQPAQGVDVRLAFQDAAGTWTALGHGTTDDDGRATDLLDESTPFQAGRYRLTFGVGRYFQAANREAFYPEVSIVFTVTAPDEHYHVPLLLNPYGYSTYRGS